MDSYFRDRTLVEELCGGAFVISDSGCRGCLLCRGRCRIQFAVTLLDPSGADMALHRDADMVWAIAGTCRVKLLSGFAGGQGKNTLAQAQASCTGSASRRLACGCSWRPPTPSRALGGVCFCGRSQSRSPSGAYANYPRLHSAADVERIAASSITVGTPRTKGDCNRTS